MEQARKLHPVMWVAAVSVSLLSAVGIAAITGLLPHAGGQNAEPAKALVSADTSAKPAEPPVANSDGPTPRSEPKPTTVKEAVQEAGKATAHVSHRAHKPVQLAQADKSPAESNVPKDAAIPPPGTPYPPQAAKPAPCADCAVVENVRLLKQQGQGSGLGAIAGGVVGGLIGNQVGGGHGRDIATVVGAVAGGYAGNTIEKNQRTTSHYEVVLRYEDGTSRIFKQDTAPPWQPGDKVKVVNGEVLPR